MPVRRFAADTDVPVAKTKSELDTLLAKHGASARATFMDDEQARAAVQFRIAGRMVRLEVRLPRSSELVVPPPGRRGSQNSVDAWLRAALDQKERAAWRRLLLVVKAKLELVADGGSTIEREFLADVLLPDGRTVHQVLSAQLEESYTNGGMPKLLGSGA